MDLEIRVIVEVETRYSSCWFPRESNNTFYRCIFKHGDGGIGGNLGGPLGEGSGGISIALGGGGSVLDCSFVCADGSQAETPNPTGMWGREGVPANTKKLKCPTLGHPPDPWPYEIPPLGEMVPPGEMPPPDERAAVTNPTEGNPNQQVNRS